MKTVQKYVKKKKCIRRFKERWIRRFIERRLLVRNIYKNKFSKRFSITSHYWTCSCFLKLYTEWYFSFSLKCPVLKRLRSLMSGSEKFRLLINGLILLHSVFEFLWRVRFQERTLIWDRASLLNGLLYNKELSNTQFGIRRLTWSYSFSSLYNWETWFVFETIWASSE